MLFCSSCLPVFLFLCNTAMLWNWVAPQCDPSSGGLKGWERLLSLPLWCQRPSTPSTLGPRPAWHGLPFAGWAADPWPPQTLWFSGSVSATPREQNQLNLPNLTKHTQIHIDSRKGRHKVYTCGSGLKNTHNKEWMSEVMLWCQFLLSNLRHSQREVVMW